MHMAYMDVEPTKPNERVVILLHGKNYVAATWRGTIAVMSDAGYRVIAPDQIGFGKSAKPAHYQYSFNSLQGTPTPFWLCSASVALPSSGIQLGACLVYATR